MNLVTRYALQNVSFTGWVDKTEIFQHLSTASICLGVFGTTQQALCTVPNKIWEGLAMRKPVITGDTPAVRDLLCHEQHLYLCESANPVALAEAIVKLFKDSTLRRKLAWQGYEYWWQNFTMKRTGQRFHQHLTEVARR